MNTQEPVILFGIPLESAKKARIDQILNTLVKSPSGPLEYTLGEETPEAYVEDQDVTGIAFAKIPSWIMIQGVDLKLLSEQIGDVCFFPGLTTPTYMVTGWFEGIKMAVME